MDQIRQAHDAAEWLLDSTNARGTNGKPSELAAICGILLAPVERASPNDANLVETVPAFDGSPQYVITFNRDLCPAHQEEAIVLALSEWVLLEHGHKPTPEAIDYAAGRLITGLPNI